MCRQGISADMHVYFFIPGTGVNGLSPPPPRVLVLFSLHCFQVLGWDTCRYGGGPASHPGGGGIVMLQLALDHMAFMLTVPPSPALFLGA